MNFRDLVKSKKLYGYWSVIPNVQLHEIFGIAGYDFAIIDMEHGTYSFQEALESVIAIKNTGMKCLIRPSSHCEKEILRCLEIGVDGICIPHVRNYQEAKSVVDACLYPPIGKRGASGFTKATSYGNEKFSKHIKKSNEDLFISILIESEEGLNNLSEILQIDRIDNIYFGTYDIASSMNIKEQDSEQVRRIISKKIDQHSSVNFGQVSVNKSQFTNLDKRINFVVLGVDCGIILNGAKDNHVVNFSL